MDVIQDIEDFIIPPVDLFKKGFGISATDLSAQVWCEKQMEFKLVTGERHETDAMRLGTARHEELENEDHSNLVFFTETKEEQFALKLLNTVILLEQLRMHGKARELWVCGYFEGVLVRGIIDELRIESKNGRNVLIISDTKTRQKPTEPSQAQKNSSAIQLQCYHVILEELCIQGVDRFGDPLLREMGYSGDFVLDSWPLDRLGKTLKEALFEYGKAWIGLPELSGNLEIVYEYKGTELSRNIFPFNQAGVYYTLNDLLSYWKGERDAEVTHEVFKCNFCPFLSRCDQSKMDPEKKIIAIQKQIDEREAKEKLKQEEKNNRESNNVDLTMNENKTIILSEDSVLGQQLTPVPEPSPPVLQVEAHLLKSEEVTTEQSVIEMQKKKRKRAIKVAVPEESSVFFNRLLIQTNLDSNNSKHNTEENVTCEVNVSHCIESNVDLTVQGQITSEKGDFFKDTRVRVEEKLPEFQFEFDEIQPFSNVPGVKLRRCETPEDDPVLSLFKPSSDLSTVKQTRTKETVHEKMACQNNIRNILASRFTPKPCTGLCPKVLIASDNTSTSQDSVETLVFDLD